MHDVYKECTSQIADMFKEIKYQTKTNEHDAAILTLAATTMLSRK